jgi:hypothetical protein
MSADTRRFARAVAAASVAAAALSGCTVTVGGAPQAQPQPAPSRVVPAPTAPPAAASVSEDAVYAEWLARGWTPQPILPVSDPDSGVSAWMFGAAERRDPAEGGIGYEALGAPASIVCWFGVLPIPAGYSADPERAAATTADARGGRVTASRRVTVSGHAGLDVRIELIGDGGAPVVDLIRYVELPHHLVAVESAGLASDERVLQQVHRIVVGELRIPAA